MPVLDYQEIINAVALVVKSALPIGIIFALAEKMVNSFFSMAFGERNVRL